MPGTATRDLLVVDAYVAELRQSAGWTNGQRPTSRRTSPRRFAATAQGGRRRSATVAADVGARAPECANA
jgi:hypothetical protein